ncbi:MAG: HRDC domain-containing protein, partial [Gemmatimonadales bacterium]
GVPEYVVLRDAVLEALVTDGPRDGRALAAVPGLGPRAVAKHGAALLALIAATAPDDYLAPMPRADEIPGRPDAGKR